MKTRLTGATLVRFGLAAGILWTILGASAYYLEYHLHNQHARELAVQTAQAYYEKDKAFRRWTAGHGGVYVPVTEDNPPSPWMSHVPEQNVETPSGRVLTLFNSAQVVREVNELLKNQDGATIRVVNHDPLRPSSVPDPWEAQALERFVQGGSERVELTSLHGEPHMRYMRPLVVREKCVKCHEDFVVGEVGGGVSVSVPMAPYASIMASHNRYSAGFYVVAWALGLTMIAVVVRRIRAQLVERERYEARLQEVGAYNEAVIGGLGEGLLGMDERGRLQFLNPEGERLLGWREEELKGQTVHDIIHFEDASGKHVPAEQCPLVDVMRTGQSRRDDNEVFVRKDGARLAVSTVATRIDRGDGSRGLVIAFQDVGQRKQAEARSHYLATHDDLTGLANRVMLMGFLENCLARARRDDITLAVLFLDLDNFKLINDTQGHVAGDRVLCQVAERLGSVIREPDVIARQGGDEFIILLTRFPEGDHRGDRHHEPVAVTARRVAERLLATLEQSFHDGELSYRVTASIGISLHPQDGSDAVTLLKQADNAMYFAKQDGGGRLAFFGDVFDEKAAKLQALEQNLHLALENGEMDLHYQPIVDMRDGAMRGVEALLRWQEPGGESIVSPDEFIPIAERTGLIVPIGRWVMQEACRQVALWRRLEPEFYVAINLSPRQFLSESLISDITGALEAHGLPAKAVELEVTEGATMRDPAQASVLLNRLHGMGFRLALDDFGTGYSSLSRLRELPFKTLKIDKSFVAGVPEDADDVTIILSTIHLARNLGLTPLAEGVETGAQHRFLVKNHCDMGQGFLFQRPVTADEITARLAGADSPSAAAGGA